MFNLETIANNILFLSSQLYIKEETFIPDTSILKTPSESNDSILKCPYCDKTFQKKKTLQNHRRQHVLSKLPESTNCKYCQFVATTPKLLKKHWNDNHPDKKTITCQICQKTFFTKADLAKHKTHHTKQKSICDVCGAVVSCESTLKVHYRIHTGHKPYVCKICAKGFAQQIALKHHELVHSDKRDFVCDVCGASFKQPTSLTTHYKGVHVIERRHKCEFCEKTFKTVNHLKNHIGQIHAGLKNFKCEVCGRDFAKVSTLKTHMIVHSGEKPYCCKLCGKKFTQSSSLGTHMRKYHP